MSFLRPLHIWITILIHNQEVSHYHTDIATSKVYHKFTSNSVTTPSAIYTPFNAHILAQLRAAAHYATSSTA